MDDQRLFTILNQMNENIKKMASSLDEMNKRFAKYDQNILENDELMREGQLKEG
jgi:hypothetical protein